MKYLILILLLLLTACGTPYLHQVNVRADYGEVEAEGEYMDNLGRYGGNRGYQERYNVGTTLMYRFERK